MGLPLVAIIGRPNVGKSTLFNRVLKDRLAITDDQPGVTRDRIYGLAEWVDKQFYLIDTGGYIPDTEDLIETMVREQAEVAMEEADLIILVVDAQVGPTDLDQHIAERLIRQKRPVLLVTNKADNPTMVNEIYAFYKLGLGEPIAVSSANGLNFGDFLDKLTSLLPKKEAVEKSDALMIAILGRPNVGKSSMANFLAGKKRQIVTDIPGTTRDAIDLHIKYGEKEYLLIDTAGLRRKSKIKENLEYFMTLRAIKALERCDVAALMIEGPTGLVAQDIQVITEIIRLHKALVICVNKWDLVEKDDHTADQFKEKFNWKLPSLSYIPLVFMSALSGKKVTNIFKLLEKVDQEQNKRIKTAVLNEFLRAAVNRQHPAAVRGKYINLFYMTQVDVKPPSFVVFSNYPKLIMPEYLRFLENQLRAEFGFEGVPLKINVKKR